MKRTIIGLLIFLNLAFVSCNDSTTTINNDEQLTEKEVREFINKYDSAWDNRDTFALKELMDEDYIYFSSTGSTLPRNSIINFFNPADKYKVDTVFRDEISIKLNENTAIVSTHWVGKGTYGTDKFDDNQRCGLVIQKRNNKIRIISEHCAQIIEN